MVEFNLIDQLKALLASPYLWAAMGAYVIGQLTKVILIANKRRITLRDFISSGNMPSTHTASVVALAAVAGVQQGLGSPIFGIATMFALVVAYDAMHVRRAVGEQGLILTQMIADMPKEQQKKYGDVLYKHTGRTGTYPYFSRGHLPEEVLVGALLGAVVGIVIGLL